MTTNHEHAARAATHRRLRDAGRAWQDEVGEWADDTFAEATPSSIAAHMRREVAEVGTAVARADDGLIVAEECADVYLLALHLCHRHGVDLHDAAVRKLAANRARTWGAPDAEGVVAHAKPRADPACATCGGSGTVESRWRDGTINYGPCHACIGPAGERFRERMAASANTAAGDAAKDADSPALYPAAGDAAKESAGCGRIDHEHGTYERRRSGEW